MAQVPFGSYPSPTQGYWRRDDDCYFEYHKATRLRAGFETWLSDWVFNVSDHAAFLDRVGRDRVARLKPQRNLIAAPVRFSY